MQKAMNANVSKLLPKIGAGTFLFFAFLLYAPSAHAQAPGQTVTPLTDQQWNEYIAYIHNRGAPAADLESCVTKPDGTLRTTQITGAPGTNQAECGRAVSAAEVNLSRVDSSSGTLKWWRSQEIRFVEGDIVQCNKDAGNSLVCIVTHRSDRSFTVYLDLAALSSEPPRSRTYNAQGQPITGEQQVSPEQEAQNIEAAGRALGENTTCSLDSPSTWGGCLGQAVALLLLKFCSFLLGLAGSLFNWVMVKAVFGFSTLVGNSPGLLAAWGIVRDIGNMLLLFGFIFIGLATILDLHTYAAKKALPRLIIFAILMNFSLFAAEAVIDVSNGLSVAFYNQGTTPCPDGSDAAGGPDQRDCAVNYGLAGHMMQTTGISSVFSPDANIDTLTISALLALSMFSLVATFVLLSASIMLIIRAVTLTFLMVLAPLGFAAMAVPALDKVGREWWNRLIHQSFYAPILILLILVSLSISEGLTGTGVNSNLAAALTNANSGVLGVIMVFALVCGFLLASIIAAKKFGAMGADFATKTAARFSFGAAGWAGRQTFGRASGLAAKGVRATPLGRTEAGRYIAGAFDKGKASSFDLRSTKAGKLAGLDLGTGQKGGLTEDQKKKAEAQIKHAEKLKNTKRQEEEIRRIEQEGEEKKAAEETNSAETLAEIAARRKALKDAADAAAKKAREDIAAKESEMSDYTTRRADLDTQIREATDAGDAEAVTELQSQLDALNEESRADVEILTTLRERRAEQEAALAQDLAELSAEQRAENKRKNKEIEKINKSVKDGKARASAAGIYAGHIERYYLGEKKTADTIRKRINESSTDKAYRQIIEKLDSGTHKADDIKDEVKKQADAAKEHNDHDDQDHGGGGGSH